MKCRNRAKNIAARCIKDSSKDESRNNKQTAPGLANPSRQPVARPQFVHVRIADKLPEHKKDWQHINAKKQDITSTYMDRHVLCWFWKAEHEHVQRPPPSWHCPSLGAALSPNDWGCTAPTILGHLGLMNWQRCLCFLYCFFWWYWSFLILSYFPHWQICLWHAFKINYSPIRFGQMAGQCHVAPSAVQCTAFIWHAV